MKLPGPFLFPDWMGAHGGKVYISVSVPPGSPIAIPFLKPEATKNLSFQRRKK